MSEVDSSASPHAKPAAKPTPLHALFSEWGAEFFDDCGRLLPLRVVGAGQEYEAARESQIVADGGDRGLLELSGGDALDFLQRLLTSDTSKLEPGHGQWSALLDGKGHWLSDLLLFRHAGTPDAGERLWLDCPIDRAEFLQQRLEMMHFGEDIQWRILEPARLLVAGPSVAAAPSAGPGSSAEGFGVQPAEHAGCVWLGRPDRGVACRELVGSAAAVEAAARQLREADATPAGWVALDILRVEAGQPRWRTDFDNESTLPETGEWHRASLSKGCYAGQEVVAKVHNFGQAPRQLCLLQFASGERSLRGAEIHDAEGKKMGVVTSWVWSPQADQPIGMGIVKRKALQQPRELVTSLGEEAIMTSWSRPDKGPN